MHADATQFHPIMDIPAHYRELAPRSNFNRLCGPYYEILENGHRIGMAIRIEEKHLNQRDITHGGMLMSLADSAMGEAAVRSYNGKAGVVTVSLNSDFLEPAKLGDWVEARPIVHRNGRTMVFIECPLYAGDRVIFRANGVFAVVERRD